MSASTEVGPVTTAAHRPAVEPRRLGGPLLVAVAAVLALAQLWLQLRGGHYGYDFRGGIWGAGRAVLDGRSPFPEADAHRLLLRPNAFINPPPLALLGAAFALLPFGAAIGLFNLASAGALVLALRLAGLRDRWIALLCLCSFPFVSSLALGQPDGILALAAAAAWRYRGSDRGALAAGALIAAKLLAWPLIIWLLLTRRVRGAAVAAGSAIGILGLSWASLGFRGLAGYPGLLAADADAFETRAHSLYTALAASGVGAVPAVVLTLLGAVAIGGAVIRAARGSDLGLFAAALTVGILASPVVWQHYFVLLFVPLAASRRPRDPVVWLLALGLWLSPSETPATLAQAWLIPVLAAALAVRIGRLSAVPAGAARAPVPTAPAAVRVWC